MPWARSLRPRPLISRSSVLILAGFLIGFSLSGSIQNAMLRTQILNCGAVGLISFIGLHFVARRRAQVVVDRLREEEAEQMRQVAESLTNVRQSLRARALELENPPAAGPVAGQALPKAQESAVSV